MTDTGGIYEQGFKRIFYRFFKCGFLISGLLYANSTTTLENVKVGGVNIVVDGKKINPTDANGKSILPIIYNGSTYLPIRSVADAFGKAVYWDGPTFTVYLGEAKGKLQYPTAYLKDLPSISDSVEEGSLTDNYGNRYDNAIRCERWVNSVGQFNHRYLTDMKYSRLKGTLYIAGGTTSNYKCYMQVIADGKTIYTSPELDKTSRPLDVDVNVTGYNDIQILLVGADKMLCVIVKLDSERGFYVKKI